MKTLIFGAGTIGKNLYEKIKGEYDIIGFLDNNSSKWGEEICGVKILGNCNVISQLTYDEIIVASLSGSEIIKNDLILAGVPENKINTSYVDVPIKARLNFLREYASLVPAERLDGCVVAEGGVLQGEFAKEISASFPMNRIILFDTFEGFDSRDLDVEKNNNFSESQIGDLNISSVEYVLNNMPYKDKVEIRKGYFPDTLEGIDESYKYIFVNIDFDLYKPILAGLKYFYPRMEKGGVILIHDYFNPLFKGVKSALVDYEMEIGYELNKLPIGDACSIAILK